MKKKLTMAVTALGLTLALAAGPASAAGKAYTAKDGDTFWKLATKFGVKVDKLMAANPEVNPLNIYAGLKITIPNGVAAASAKAASTAKVKALSAKSITADGKSYAVAKTLELKATAYSSAASENGKWGAVDYFGNPLKLGTVAVDPKVIPLGTKLYVTGYDHDGLPKGGFVAKASDTGGAIKGNRMDIFIPGAQSDVRTFGFQQVKVYVLK